MLWGRDPPDGQAPVGSITSPAQLDFELPLIGLQLKLHLDLHLVWNMDLEVHPTALELEVIVARQVVCKGKKVWSSPDASPALGGTRGLSRGERLVDRRQRGPEAVLAGGDCRGR